MGLYCLNTIRYLLGEEPAEVSAYIHSTPNDPRFTEVEEQVNWLMKFPSGVQTSCATSYGPHDDKNYKVLALIQEGFGHFTAHFSGSPENYNCFSPHLYACLCLYTLDDWQPQNGRATFGWGVGFFVG